MRFQFNPNQEHQVQAVEAVTDLFVGQACTTLGFSLQSGHSTMLAAVPNRLDLDEETLLVNLRDVQRRNGIQPDAELKVIEERIDKPDGPAVVRFANFSIEMETGTGRYHPS
jgi:type III restriction enzyme